MNEKTRIKAWDILEGMRTIASADMMEPGSYISDSIVDPKRRKAICGGHKACAIGSLWLAAGVKPIYRNFTGSYALPGVKQSRHREDFLSHRHSLRAAYDALNEAAQAYIDKHSIEVELYDAPVESLFESEDEHLDGDNRRKVMLKVISSAKRKLKEGLPV